MRYIERLIIIFVFCSFSIFFASSLRTYKELKIKSNLLIEKTDKCTFISESFKKSCDGKCFKDLNQWQKVCKSLFNLDYIGWCQVDDFMPISSENKKILYGKWVSNVEEGEIYWEVNNE